MFAEMVIGDDSMHGISSPGSCSACQVEIVEPGMFEASEHFYPRVLNAQIHPLVRSFLCLGNDRIIKRYCHLHPEVSSAGVTKVLKSATR